MYIYTYIHIYIHIIFLNKYKYNTFPSTTAGGRMTYGSMLIGGCVNFTLIDDMRIERRRIATSET